MSGIDERIVRMTFDNRQFEQGTSATLSTLSKLKDALKLEGAAKGFSDVEAASNKVSLSTIADGVENIAGKFKALSVIGITALTNIANRAINAGVDLVKSLTVNPIQAGLQEYETNLNAVQTILANTGLEGQKGLDKVNAALADLNHYSDQTIYNFSEMARNIGTFTAAGVKLDVATGAIKGIANLAAISGSNAEQASTAMYQLSQALAAGKVTLQDWNSVVNAGMGGKVFQDALMETARVHGVAIDKMVKDEGGFRNTLQKGWLSSDILTETLNKFTGDLSAAQLKQMGYTEKQITDIMKMAKTAQDAATKVKTFSQLIDTLQEAVGSGWGQTWQLLFGDFEEAKKLFTNVSNVIGGFINASSNARNKVLGDWKELGGREALIEGIGNVFNGVTAIVKVFSEAFRSIFPPITGQKLFDLTLLFNRFTFFLKMGSNTANELKRTFAGLFAVLDIGWLIIKEVVKTVFDLVGMATKGSGSILNFTANLGDFLVGIRNAIVQGNLITKVFEKIRAVLEAPITLLRALAGHLKSLFGGISFSGQDAVKAVTGLVGKLAPLTHLGDTIAETWKKVVKVMGDVWDVFEPLAKKVGAIFKKFGDDIRSSFDNLDYQSILKGIQTGLFGGLLLLVHQFVNKMHGGGDSGIGGILDTIKESFEGLTKTLSTMQTTLKAATLLELAAAIGILAVSIVVLSKIDGKALLRSMTAITMMFTQLLMAMAIIEKIIGTGGFIKMPLIAAAMIPMAIAVDILTIAVKSLASLDWNGLAKGLSGVAGMLVALVAAVKFMPPSAGLISAGAGLTVLAAAILVLVQSVKQLSGLNWTELGKGLTGVAGLLVGLTLFTKFAEADKGGIFSGAGIVLLAGGIKILASAMQDFAKFSWTEIAKGLATMAGSLALIGAALALIPPTAPLSAAGITIVAASLGMIGTAIGKMGAIRGIEIAKGLTALGSSLIFIGAALTVIPPSSILSAAAIFVVAASLGKIGEALQKMGQMSWTAIAKSLIELAVSLGIIAGAMILMTEALPGAAALLVVAASLAILAPILQMFGQMSWTEMGKGLLMLAGIFVVIGLAGLVLTPLVPVLLGLGLAITLMGIGALAAGVGVLAFATALTVLSVAGAAGATAIVAIVSGLIGLIPVVVEQIGKGLVLFAQVIATAGPAILDAITTVLLALVQAIVNVTPKITEALLQLLQMMIDKLNQYMPRLIVTGNALILTLLRGVRDHIGGIVEVSLEIIAAYINGISAGLPKVVQSAANLIITFINSVADAIRNNSEALGRAGGNLASAIVEGMVNGLKGGVGKVIDEAERMATSALKAAMRAIDAHSPSREFHKVGMYSAQGMALGLQDYSGLVSDTAASVGTDAVDSIRKSISGLANVMTADIDMTPVITPVLDLTEVQKGAGTIGNMISANPITIDGIFATAKATSLGYMRNQLAFQPDQSIQSAPVTYNQYNTSPKALSAAEIYRQTKNQISVSIGALPI